MFDHHFITETDINREIKKSAKSGVDGFCVMLGHGDKPRLPKLTGFDVTMGLQCDFDFATHETLAMQTAGIPYDYIVNNVTSVDGNDLLNMGFYTAHSRSEAYSMYIDRVFDSLDAAYDYSVLAPIGYVGNYAYYPSPLLMYREFPEMLDSLIMRTVFLGKGLEVDASAINRYGEPIPSSGILRRYRELGGEIITVGSYGCDAALLKEAYGMLLDCGFRYYTVFRNKVPQMIKL